MNNNGNALAGLGKQSSETDQAYRDRIKQEESKAKDKEGVIKEPAKETHGKAVTSIHYKKH